MSDRNSALRWLEFAQTDVRMAQLALPESLFAAVCFHAQQAVEKSMKAILAMREENIPKTHSLARLSDQIGGSEFDDLEAALTRLDDVYLTSRYPDLLPGSLPEGLPTQQVAEQVLAAAQIVYERVSSMME